MDKWITGFILAIITGLPILCLAVVAQINHRVAQLEQTPLSCIEARKLFDHVRQHLKETEQ